MSRFRRQAASRGLNNKLEEIKGEVDAGVEFVEGVWNFAVDVVDFGVQVLSTIGAPMDQAPQGFLEHNETQAGLARALNATGTYVSDTVQGKKSLSELGNDMVGAGESLVDPFVKVNDDREKGNVFTHSAEESYNAGYNGVKAVERVVDIVSVVKGGAKLAKSVGDMSKSPSSVHGESAGGKSAHGDGNSGGRPVITPHWKYNLHEAAKSLGGDGKFKTNALRLPLGIASLESFMQSIANRMNIFSKKLVPVGFGKISNGRPRWEFEDYSRMDSDGRGGSGGGPDKPPKDHHEDERKRREDDTEGTGEVKHLTDPEEMKPFIAPPKDGYDAFLERSYIEIRKVGLEDVPIVSKNTGLTVEQVTKMKEHLFLTIRDLSIDGKPYEKLYFQADPDIAYGWQQAQIRELNVKEKDWFKSLADHELKERDIMLNGYIDKDGNKIGPLPLRDPITWDGTQYGKNPLKNAHDAANEMGAVQPTNNFPTYTDEMKYNDWDNNFNQKIKY